MRVIERHEVAGDRLAAALTGFADRIADSVHRMQHDEDPAFGWHLVANDFLDHLGARSVDHPELTGSDVREAVRAAADAGLGSLRLAATGSAHVMIEYVNEGVDHSARPDSVDPGQWLRTFWLAYLLATQDRHAQDFRTAAARIRTPARSPAHVLVRAVVAHAYGAEGGAGAEDAARDPVEPTGAEHRAEHAALRTLRALEAGDEPGFTQALTAQLEEHRKRSAQGSPRARTLLPLDAIALAAMARREHGWHLATASGYLPEALVGGVRPPAPRVGAFGRDPRPEALAELAAGPLEIPRPPMDFVRKPGDFDRFADRDLAEFADPAEDALGVARCMELLMDTHLTCFVLRAAAWPQEQEERCLRDLRITAEAGVACVELAAAEPGTGVEVTIAGTTRALPAPAPHRALPPHHWANAADAALVLGDPALLAGLLAVDRRQLTHPHAPDVTTYAEALHAFLTGTDAVAVTRAALAAVPRTAGGRRPSRITVLSQLAAGDERGFTLALADALETHRDYYAVGSRPRDHAAGLDLSLLALTHHAGRLGLRVDVVSPYLPDFLGVTG